MLIKYFKNLFSRFKKTKPITKILVFLFILIELFLVFISFYQVEYSIITPGGLSYAQSTVTITNGSKPGNVYTVSVFEYKETSLIQYWLAKNDKKLVVEEKVDVDTEAETKYGIISRKIAINNAIMLAYEKASEIDDTIFLAKTYKGCIVSMLDNAKTDLSVDDIITHVNGEKIISQEDLIAKIKNILAQSKEGDFIKFTCITEANDKPIDKNLTIKKTNNGLECGIAVRDFYYLDGENSTPKFKINYDPRTDGTGGSGGALLTLAIYNQLLEEDVTYGLSVVGTGTISLDGTIGAIGCVKQKLTKAYLANAPIFLVDAYDYEEALEGCKEYGYDPSFVYKVETFDDILKTLKEIHERSEKNE